MEPIFACALLFISFAAEPALSIQCYNCTAVQMQMMNAPEGLPEGFSLPTMSPAEKNCFDPFNMEGVQMIECSGKCYAQLSTTTGDYASTAVERGCDTMSEQCGSGCFDPNAMGPPGAPQMTPPPGTPQMTPPPGVSGELCRYCCDSDLCNTLPIEETARSQAPAPVEGTRNCYSCEQAKADATEGSCASDDFDGEGITKVECSGQCVLMDGKNDQMVDAIYRGCDTSPNSQMCQMTGATCCTGELCNGNGDDDGDDDDVKPIDCWKCSSVHSEEMDSECAKGMFKEATNDTMKVTCPTGICVKLIKMVNDTTSNFVRDCLMPEIGDDICEEDASDNEKYKMYSKVECCKKNMCNGAPVVTSSLTAIVLGTSYILVSYALM